jgi:nitrogen fixation-related uncharacterized protein
MASGLYIAFGICAVFFVVGVAAMAWAFKNGEFEDMEDVKFDMLDDSPDGVIAQRAKKALEKARAAQQVSN